MFEKKNENQTQTKNIEISFRECILGHSANDSNHQVRDVIEFVLFSGRSGFVCECLDDCFYVTSNLQIRYRAHFSVIWTRLVMIWKPDHLHRVDDSIIFTKVVSRFQRWFWSFEASQVVEKKSTHVTSYLCYDSQDKRVWNTHRRKTRFLKIRDMSACRKGSKSSLRICIVDFVMNIWVIDIWNFRRVNEER